jgi:hypothetical protein
MNVVGQCGRASRNANLDLAYVTAMNDIGLGKNKWIIAVVVCRASPPFCRFPAMHFFILRSNALPIWYCIFD